MVEAARAQVISANGATDTVFLNYSAPNVRFKINNGFYSVVTWPCTIVNTSLGASTLRILLENDLTLANDSEYFICGSDGLQFGSASLKSDGTRPVVTVDGVVNYPGLVRNGDVFGNGQANISIFNLEVRATGATTLAQFGGWIGQAYFGKAAAGGYIVNCSSDGDMGSSSGGIVGRDAGSDGGNLTILGCSSSGVINSDAGGIAGFNSGNAGEVIVRQSWSSGAMIGNQGGGIFGSFSAFNGNVTAENCFSVGVISVLGGGGIFGQSAGGGTGFGNAIRCYSRGDITGADAGGIFGADAAPFGGDTDADNSYSSGTVAGVGAGGIYGANPGGGTVNVNTYTANGTWSSVAAKAALVGTPAGGSVIGTTWADTALNQPYDFSKFGYTPYSTNNISIAGGVPSLVQSFSQTVTAGSSSSAAIISGLNYTILQKSKGGVVDTYPTITINNNTGVISTTGATSAGTYTLTIDNEVSGVASGYQITEVLLTVNAATARITSSLAQQALALRQAYAYQITADNTPNSYGASGLPPGLSVNARTGRITGTPSRVGTYRATLTATRRLPGQPTTTATGTKVYVVTKVAKKGW